MKSSKGTRPGQADGKFLRHYGERAVKMYSNDSHSTMGKVVVRDIHKPIIAAGDLTDAGSGLWFHRTKSYIITREKADDIAKWMASNLSGGEVINVEKQRGVFEIRVQAGIINAFT